MPEIQSKKEAPPTIITLTLPTPEGGGISLERATATLLIQRGELAHIHQFHYQGALSDMIDAIREAHDALGQVEENPPVIPELPEEKPRSKGKSKSAPTQDDEPTIDIPLKKGVKTIKISHLKIVGGETDAIFPVASDHAVCVSAAGWRVRLWVRWVLRSSRKMSQLPSGLDS